MKGLKFYTIQHDTHICTTIVNTTLTQTKCYDGNDIIGT